MKLSNKEIKAREIFYQETEQLDWLNLPTGTCHIASKIELDGHFSLADLEILTRALREYFENIKEDNQDGT